MTKRIVHVVGMLAALGAGTAAADSLYQEASYKPLIADARALRVGDNLTVVVTEFASVTAKARTGADKSAALSASVEGDGRSHTGAINFAEDFDGGGRIERSGKLVAQLTVMVDSIEPNGDLRVKGRQDISVNGEIQTLAIEGRVRPQDVGANNTVPSTRLSEAKISYVGDGLLAEKQSPGILTRFLDWLGIL
jgi:flagellar L-ring protein FlgH